MPPEVSQRRILLEQAAGLVDGDRNADYGPPDGDFTAAAFMWQAYLHRTFGQRGGLKLTAHDVAAMMIMLKLARIAWSPDKQDHWADIAGYAACGWDCVA
jgi:hypothetical protein